MPESALTYFAPAERTSPEELARQCQLVSDPRVLGTLLDDVPTMLLILNSCRQVVYANRALLDAVSAPEVSCVLGRRPGELFHCKRAANAPGGCGTSQFCRYCGAVGAILSSQGGKPDQQECRITIEQGNSEEALDLRVDTRPVEVAGERFTCLSIVDIADMKRRQFLERTFLHDLMNTAAGLHVFADLVGEIGVKAKQQRDALGKITLLADRIVAEINAYQRLAEAEQGKLQLDVQTLDSLQILQDVSNTYDRPDLLNGSTLMISKESEAIRFESDPVLLSRILGNMVKNALEASLPGETVILACCRKEGAVAFRVWNRACMPEAVRRQVFNRSFSTKQPGRGLGTYSMKYLTEKYLGGGISFTSTEAEGTTFVVHYPLAFRGRPPVAASASAVRHS